MCSFYLTAMENVTCSEGASQWGIQYAYRRGDYTTVCVCVWIHDGIKMLNKVAKLLKSCLISPLSPVYPLCLCVLVASRITNTVLSAQGGACHRNCQGKGDSKAFLS